MIPWDLHRSLVDTIAGLPQIADGDDTSRATTLLSGLPQVGWMNRNRTDAYGDVLLIVNQLAETFGPDSRWHLIQMIDNAIAKYAGTDPAKKLTGIRAELVRYDAGQRPSRLHPSEVAQIHLFDLVSPVMNCIGMLPNPCTASAFAVFTPTARLLHYFCQSLRHRGAEYHKWNRNEIGTVSAPLQVDFPHTGVGTVLDKAARVGPLLARQHVIFPVYAPAPGDVETIWRGIDATAARSGGHHLIVAFGLPPGSDLPDGVQPLPEPRFTTADLRQWVNEIGQSQDWQRPVVSRWTDVILRDVDGRGDTDLPIELVYDTLDTHCGIVQLNRTPEELLNALAVHEAMGWGG